jgi:hypothetical protein
MPDDGSNVGHIEPPDAYDALVEALEGGRARNRRRQQRQRERRAGPHTLGEVALGDFARAFGRETSKTVLANVARAWREGRSRWVQAPRQARSAALPAREARHDARPVGRTSRGAALRDASSRRPLSARPILSGATQSVRWAQHAPRLSLCSRTGLARSNARQRRPSSPRRDLSASPRLSSRSSCRRSMTGRRQNSHGGRTAALEEMAGMRK